MSTGADPQPARTPLWDLHRSRGGRMVPFAGYELPLHYSGRGAIKEHLHTREAASLFDIGHMGVVDVRRDRSSETGLGIGAALESVLPASLVDLQPGRQRYSFLTNGQGGISDDVMVANYGDGWTMVVNAACKHQDVAYLRSTLPAGITAELREDLSLLALQGPASEDALTALGADVAGMAFMGVATVTLGGVDVRCSRSGYTGEDGFELVVPGARAADLAGMLLEVAGVEPAGLAARDSLRLEAGLCLYGADLDPTTSPVEAGLTWAVARRRREGGGFPGWARMAAELESGPARRRVGILPAGRRPVRAGAQVEAAGSVVGAVTSGGFGPSTGGPVAMGYVGTDFCEVGTELVLRTGDRMDPATVAALPFVPHRYRR
ncbi:MAG: glycine cleavage system aminomethyltransferase GcvT [Actinomycetota bacterium]|nr:glycine cleavage system aminomethyltransferase GcvT [Actinomycetota bacterium]